MLKLTLGVMSFHRCDSPMTDIFKRSLRLCKRSQTIKIVVDCNERRGVKITRLHSVNMELHI